MNKSEVYEFLNANGIHYEVTEHIAVYNMEEMREIPVPYPEADAKNLFVRDDKKQKYYLITVQGDRRVDLKAFRKANGTRPLSFASPEDMMALLRLTPGSVTPLGLLNDAARSVIFCIDRDLCGGMIGCHPNDNTATVWMRTEDLLELIRAHGNEIRVCVFGA